MSAIQGWWFCDSDVLPNGDGRAVVAGETLHVEGEIIPCKRGLHLSERVIDALKYANRDRLWRVEGSVTVVAHGDPVDKHACSDRTHLWAIDAEPVLRRFARYCALDVIHLWDAPEIVVRYLTTGDESIRAHAGAAAWAAARDAATRIAWAAASTAASTAAWTAAWDAARTAARDAASTAAWDAARTAARDAASTAAWDAAWDRYNTVLTDMVNQYHEGTLDLSKPLEVPVKK